MNLKPQDLVVALKLAVHHQRAFVLVELASELCMPLSSVHGSITRAEQARLVSRATGSVRAIRPAVLEFSVHGARYAYPGQLGAMTRGTPTGVGGPALRRYFEASVETPVWPHPEGKTRGPGLQPLYAGASAASIKDETLYEVLTLVDALRVGAARERSLASEGLRERLA